MRLSTSFVVISNLADHVIFYPTSTRGGLSTALASTAGFSLVIQFISGILLAMNYTPHIDLAFVSVEYISRNLYLGWLLKNVHSLGASLFFLAVYLHMFKNIERGGVVNNTTKILGGIIFILTMAIAFMGYLLPWGQMSFWAATVITNIFTVIPVFGADITEWLWGGFVINNATLNRFFSLHYLLPFVLVGVIFLHLGSLHVDGDEKKDFLVDTVDFYPYFYLKDLSFFLGVLVLFVFLVCFKPNLVNHYDNYVEANELLTPPHIVPEWYFLPFYAILRAIPHKTGGILVMILTMLFLFDSDEQSIYSIHLYFLLGYFGARPISDIYNELTQYTFFLFVVDYFFTEEEEAYVDLMCSHSE